MADDKRYMGFWIGHLHEGERNRIHSGGLNPQESEMLAKGEDPWAKFRGPLPPESKPETTSAPQSESRGVVDEWYSDDPNDVSFITGKRRKFTALRVPSPKNPEPPEPAAGGIKVPGQTADYTPTEEERREAELLEFMPKPLRAEYDKADPKRKAALWEANERNFEAANKREEERLRRYKEKTEKALDMLHRLREDPSKSDLLPPDDASMDEIHKWHDKMSQPKRIVPFPGEGGYPQGTVTNSATPAGDDTREIVQQQKGPTSPHGRPFTAADLARVVEKANGLPAFLRPEPLSNRALSQYPPFRSLAKHPKISFWSGLGAMVAGIGFELSNAAVLPAFCFLIAWVIWSLVLYFSPAWEKSRSFSILSMVLIGAALTLLWWANLPSPPPTAEQIAVEVMKRIPAPSPSAPSPVPSPRPSPTDLAAPPAALKSQRDIPFKGQEVQSIADLMRADGYTGTTVMSELYVQSHDENQEEIRIGPQRDLTVKNSDILFGSERMDYRNGADTTTIFIRSPRAGKINVTYRPRL